MPMLMRGTPTLLLAAAALIVAAAAPRPAQAQQTEAKNPQVPGASAGPQRIQMTVHGLSCPFCAYGLEKKLRRIEGLDSLSIDFRSGNVVLEVQDGTRVTDERIRALVKDAGFAVGSPINRSPLPPTPSPEDASPRVP